MDQDLREYLDGKFGSLDHRLEAMDHRLEAMDHRLEAMDHRLEAMDHRLEAMDHRLEAMDHRFEEIEQRLSAVEGIVGEMDGRFSSLEAVLTEKMRDMQTELLRGFEAFTSGFTLRLRMIEAENGNLNTGLRERMNVLEGRLTQIELRLNRPPQ